MLAIRNRNRSGSLSRRLEPGMADRKKTNSKHRKAEERKPALNEKREKPFRARDLVKTLGPGLITGASDDDPSGIGTYSQAGAQLGYGIGWTMLLTFPLMAAIQEISARVGRVTGHGIAGNVCRHYSATLLNIVVALLFVDVGALAFAHVPWGEAVTGILAPRLTWSADYLTSIVAIFGTTISPYLF